MAWTSDQLKAIKTRGGKILVSAAAGSGKTAVLSERVLDYVLSGGDIDKLLVVTFTDAAAVEMKTRIKKKIEDEVAKDSENKHLIKQLTLIDNAKISTMDSFYSELVKQNFDKLGIMPNFSILASFEEELLKNKVVVNVMDSYFEKDGFEKLLNLFNASTKDLIKDKIISVANFLSTIPFYEEYISEVKNKYASSYYKDLFIGFIKDKMTSYKNLYEEIKEELYNASSDFDKLTNNIYEEEKIIAELISATSFDEIGNTIRLASFSRLPSIKGHKDDFVYNKYKAIRDNLKKEITKKMTYLIAITDTEYQRQMSIMSEAISLLFDIVIDYKKALLEEKKKINKYSFNDIPLFVIELLIKDKKKTSLAEEISKAYDEILIDEYQDTNKLQSIIFNAISKNETNLFTVGDIKQSIYKFRSACPEIFNDDKNNSYKDKFPMIITLSKNFRSRDLVLDFCNFIFECVMSSYLGEVEYNDDEKLYTGAFFPENNNAISEIDIINFEEKTDNDDEDLSKVEKEAIHVADKIKDLIDNKYQVYDKGGFYRDITPSDIAILARSLANSDIYINALKNKGISVYCNKDLVFFDNYDVKLIISVLKVIDNYYDDISLMTVLKSNLFNISDNDIAKVRINNKYSYLYDSIRKSDDINLNNALNILEDIKNYSNNNSLEDIINYLYLKLDVINIIGTNKNKVKNLTLMIKNAKDFESNSSKSLHEFVSYIEEVLLDKSSFAGANPLSDGKNVLMTTIHRSKGLEYPVVFLCDTGKKFNEQDFRNDYLIDTNYGIAFDMFDYENNYKYETIPMMVLKKKLRLLNLSEELRILYVALTRAREKLIITGYVNNLTSLLNKISFMMGDKKEVSTMYLEECNKYIEWILASTLKHKDAKVLREYANVDCKTYLSDAKFKINIVNANDIKACDILGDNNEVVFEEEIKINYDENDLFIPEHLSVSDIKTMSKKYVRKPYFLTKETKSTNVGTLYHKIFELLPIKKYSISSLKEELNNLNITLEEKKIIDIENIFAYLTSDLYDMILNSDMVYKEKEVMFYAPSSYYENKKENGTILLDGIIDLLFIKDDTYYIVDYKTDNVSSLEDLKDLYKVQLDLYEMALKQKGAKKIRKFIYSIKLNKYIEI